MEIKDIKKYLLQDRSRVEELLSYFGFHDFNYPINEQLRCALPDGGNNTSVSIFLNEHLYGTVFSRNNFKGDVFQIISEFCNRSNKEVFSITRTLFNLPGFKTSTKRYDIVGDLRKYRKKKEDRNRKHNELHEMSILNGYVMLSHSSIIEEGISPKVCRDFKICYDPQGDRIVFPHFDWEDSDKVVGLQARTVIDAETAKLLGVNKYMNYIKGYKKEYNLYGYSHNKEYIKESKKMILFEGEKSVLKLNTFNRGVSSAVAVGGSYLSKEQIRFISRNTSIDTEIVFAFDNDIMTDKARLDDFLETIRPLAMIREVSYIKDPFNGRLLQGKDSPVDKGMTIWKVLFDYRVKV